MNEFLDRLPSKEEVEKLAKANLPAPGNFKTVDIVRSNSFISVIKKEDGTYAIRNETTGEENGCYLIEEDAIGVYNDLIAEK